MRKLLMTTMCVLFVAGAALGDWDPDNPIDPKDSTNHKMHFPQMPNPNGWDVNFVHPKILADDWKCTQTGPVSDVHFWMSSRNDEMPQLESIHVSIHKNIPANPDAGVDFSLPGEQLGAWDFDPSQFTIRQWHETGQQGWYDPNTGDVQHPDHDAIWQVNIKRIPNPVTQQVGEIYWLDLMVHVVNAGTDPIYGWKTTFEVFEDQAVWADFPAAGADFLWEPIFIADDEAVDFAFVITPEPATMSLLVLGGLVALRRRRRT